MQYQFTQLRLDKEEFYNLIFMNTPPWWESEYHRKRNHSDPELTEGQQFLRKLCGKTLGEVVKKVTEKSGIDFRTEDITSTDVFEKLNMKAKHRRGAEESDPWFKPHVDLSRDFKKKWMPPIWIRNLSEKIEDNERDKCPNGSFYIEDGNHRALVYVLRIECREEKFYEPFDAIHGTSWDIATGVLGFHPQKADVLENNGILRHKKHFISGVRLPMGGILVDAYERRE